MLPHTPSLFSLILWFMNALPTRMSVKHLCAWCPQMSEDNIRTSCYWTCVRLHTTTLWVLGTNPGTSAKALNLWTIFPTPKDLLFYLYACVYVCHWMLCVLVVPLKDRRGYQTPTRAGVIGSCEPLNVGAGNGTQVLRTANTLNCRAIHHPVMFGCCHHPSPKQMK